VPVVVNFWPSPFHVLFQVPDGCDENGLLGQEPSAAGRAHASADQLHVAGIGFPITGWGQGWPVHSSVSTVAENVAVPDFQSGETVASVMLPPVAAEALETSTSASSCATAILRKSTIRRPYPPHGRCARECPRGPAQPLRKAAKGITRPDYSARTEG